MKVEALSKEISTLPTKEKETVFQSFSLLFQKMLLSFVDYIKKNQKPDSSTVSMPVSEARQRFKEIKLKVSDLKEDESKSNLNELPHRMMDVFFTQGPLTPQDKSEDESEIKFLSLSKEYKIVKEVIYEWVVINARHAYHKFANQCFGADVVKQINQIEQLNKTFLKSADSDDFLMVKAFINYERFKDFSAKTLGTALLTALRNKNRQIINALLGCQRRDEMLEAAFTIAESRASNKEGPIALIGENRLKN